MSVIEFEPVYRTDWPLEDGKNRHSFRSVISTWSAINQVAFTSHGFEEDLTSTSKWSKDEHYIHVIDPNKPWDFYSTISGHSETITHLQWNPSGSNLLSVDDSGVYRLWAMKNCVVNDWQCERTVDIGDKIVCMSWLGTSAKYLFGDVPRDLNHLMAAGSAQMFPRNKAKHPVPNFCGMTRDGWIAITETGKVCFVSMNADVAVAKTRIDTDLQGIQAGDISFDNDGYIVLGLADGLVGSVARFYKVSLSCTANTGDLQIGPFTVWTTPDFENTNGMPTEQNTFTLLLGIVLVTTTLT